MQEVKDLLYAVDIVRFFCHMESADTFVMWMYQRYTCGRAITEWCLLTFKPFWLV